MTLKTAKVQFNNSGAWTLHQKRNLRKMLDTVYADQNGSLTNVTAGTGISTGTGTIVQTSVTEIDDIITTKILLDITGLHSTGAGDIIGVDGTALYCNIGQSTTAENGIVIASTMSCSETPVGGDTDIDLYSATVGTGVEDGAISSLTQTSIINGASLAVGGEIGGIGVAATEWLYLVAVGATDADYSAGRFLITLTGYRA
jgi:hypothetical protein